MNLLPTQGSSLPSHASFAEQHPPASTFDVISTFFQNHFQNLQLWIEHTGNHVRSVLPEIPPCLQGIAVEIQHIFNQCFCCLGSRASEENFPHAEDADLSVSEESGTDSDSDENADSVAHNKNPDLLVFSGVSPSTHSARRQRLMDFYGSFDSSISESKPEQDKAEAPSSDAVPQPPPRKAVPSRGGQATPSTPLVPEPKTSAPLNLPTRFELLPDSFDRPRLNREQLLAYHYRHSSIPKAFGLSEAESAQIKRDYRQLVVGYGRQALNAIKQNEDEYTSLRSHHSNIRSLETWLEELDQMDDQDSERDDWMEMTAMDCRPELTPEERLIVYGGGLFPPLSAEEQAALDPLIATCLKMKGTLTAGWYAKEWGMRFEHFVQIMDASFSAFVDDMQESDVRCLLEKFLGIVAYVLGQDQAIREQLYRNASEMLNSPVVRLAIFKEPIILEDSIAIINALLKEEWRFEGFMLSQDIFADQGITYQQVRALVVACRGAFAAGDWNTGKEALLSALRLVLRVS